MFHFLRAILCAWCVYDLANTHVVRISWWALAIIFLVWSLESFAEVAKP